jgi:hypothetical protein
MLPPNFIGQWQYDALRENSGVSATDLAHLNTAREPLLQALAMPFVYRALVLNAKKTVLDISANEQGQVVMQTNHFAGDFDSKFDNVVRTAILVMLIEAFLSNSVQCVRCRRSFRR